MLASLETVLSCVLTLTVEFKSQISLCKNDGALYRST